jgi:hypothetical protein
MAGTGVAIAAMRQQQQQRQRQRAWREVGIPVLMRYRGVGGVLTQKESFISHRQSKAKQSRAKQSINQIDPRDDKHPNNNKLFLPPARADHLSQQRDDEA